MEVDSFGIKGMAIDAALVIFFFGMAVIAFVFCWIKGRLDMDEDAKYQMMKTDEWGDEKNE